MGQDKKPVGPAGASKKTTPMRAPRKTPIGGYQLNLAILRQNVLSDPMGPQFNYAQEFQRLDYAPQKRHQSIVTQSQDWWPADFGNYGILSAWPGTVPAPTVPAMAVEAHAVVSSVCTTQQLARQC